MATARRLRTSNAAARAEPPPPPPPPPRGTRAEQSRGYVNTSTARGKDVYDETTQQVDGEPVEFPEGTHPATVRMSLGMTLNLGNYESLRIDCGITIPCLNDPESHAAAMDEASDFCTDRLNAEQERWLPPAPTTPTRTR